VVVFSNFDKSSSVTRVPVAAAGAERLSCRRRSLPLPPSPWSWGSASGAVPLVPMVPALRCHAARGRCAPTHGTGQQWHDTVAGTHAGDRWQQWHGGGDPRRGQVTAVARPGGGDLPCPTPRASMERGTEPLAVPQPGVTHGGSPRPHSPGRAVGLAPLHAGSQGTRSPRGRAGRSVPAMETSPARSLSFPTLIFSSDSSFSGWLLCWCRLGDGWAPCW